MLDSDKEQLREVIETFSHNAGVKSAIKSNLELGTPPPPLPLFIIYY